MISEWEIQFHIKMSYINMVKDVKHWRTRRRKKTKNIFTVFFLKFVVEMYLQTINGYNEYIVLTDYIFMNWYFESNHSKQNYTDHICITKKLKKTMEDVRIRRGTDIQ